MTTSITTLDNTQVVNDFVKKEDLMTKWLAFVDRTPSTAKAYTQAVKRFFVWLYDNHISAPKRNDIIRYREEMLKVDKLAPASVKLNLNAVKLFIAWLASEGIYPNVALNVHAPQCTNDFHQRAALSADGAKKVLDGIKTNSECGFRDKLIMSIMTICGLRSVEVIRLDVADVEKRGNKFFLIVHGKARAGKLDRVPLPNQLYAMIQLYKQQCRKNAPADAPLFVSNSPRCKGQRLTTATISRLAKKYLICAGFTDKCYSCHSCRHSFANIAISGNDKFAPADIRDVQLCLRHKSVTTTEIYLHDDKIFKNRTCDLVYSLIFGEAC